MMVGIVEVVGLLVNARGATGRPRRRPGWLAGSVDGRRRRRSSCWSSSGSCSRCCPATAGGSFHDAASRSTPGARSARRPTRRRRPGRRVVRGTTSRATRAARSTPSTTTSCRRWPRSAETNGCGRATWENNEDNGQYGTTMALMLLPHWTDGCIASMEGLFFEASGTTPYHFLTTAAMSKQSSNPVRELRYDNNDAAVGVPHLQALGVRYVMVRTDEAKARGRGAARAELLATESGRGRSTRSPTPTSSCRSTSSRSSSNGRDGDQRERNLELGTSWFQHRDEWAAMPADDGPDDWQRIDVAVDESRAGARPDRPADDPDTRGKQVDIVVPRAADRARRAARRSRSATSRSASRTLSFQRRPGRRAGAREGQLLPELGRSTAPRARTASPPT